MFAVNIKAFGAYAPPLTITNDDLSRLVDTTDEWIVSRTGICRRHLSTGENTSDLCAKAGEAVLKNAGIPATDIDVIIVCTLTPDYGTPSAACMVQGALGATNAFAFDLSAACTGFVYGLSVAEKLLQSGLYKNALVLGGETLSKILNWQDRSTCVLFGDGAGGVLLSAEPCSDSVSNGILAEDLHADGAKGVALLGGHQPVVHPFLEAEVATQDFYMDGRGVLDFVLKSVPKSIRAVCDKHGLPVDEVDYIVPHQANLRMVEALAKKLKLDISKFYINIQEYGNTSAATIPMALAEMAEKGLITPGSGQKLVLVGFGGGLTWGSLLIQL